MQQPSPQNMPIPPSAAMAQQQQQMEKLENISKVKQLLGPLRESLKNVFNSAACLLTHNNNTNNGTKNDSQNLPRFDKHLEEFYSICDQIELNLMTAKRCLQQITQAQTHLPVPVVPVAQENAMTYMQFRELVITQLTYAKDIHDTLQMAAQNI